MCHFNNIIEEMKYRFCLIVVYLIYGLGLYGCATPPKPVLTEPIKIGFTTSDGYTYEVWKRPNGTYFIKHNGHEMDLYYEDKK